MHHKVTFIVVGEPIPKAKSQGRMNQKTGQVYRYIPKRTKDYEKKIHDEGLKHFSKPIPKPITVTVSVIFRIRRPTNMIWKTKPMPEVPHWKRPDVSNLVKSVEDGLNAVAYQDDGQISEVNVKKVYHAGDGRPEAEITIEWDEP